MGSRGRERPCPHRGRARRFRDSLWSSATTGRVQPRDRICRAHSSRKSCCGSNNGFCRCVLCRPASTDWNVLACPISHNGWSCGCLRPYVSVLRVSRTICYRWLIGVSSRRRPIRRGPVHSARAAVGTERDQAYVPADCGVIEYTTFIGKGERSVGEQYSTGLDHSVSETVCAGAFRFPAVRNGARECRCRMLPLSMTLTPIDDSCCCSTLIAL